MKIEWLGHAGFKISGKKIIYIDPFQVASNEKADIILVTHPHYDHCSIEDLKKLVKIDTVIVAPIECHSKIAAGKFHFKEFMAIAPETSLAVYNCSITGVPAYNIGKQFHKKTDEWVGFLLNFEDKMIYHAGDTDFIPEMASFKADIAIFPVGGTYTMNAREAAQAAAMIRPKIAIPMHYGSIIGSESDAEVFKRTVAHSKVEIMEKNVPLEIK